MSRKSKYDGVYEILKQEIASLTVGAKVPSVRQLMERLELSQAPISRALRQLQDEGVISSVTGSGTFKADPAAAGQRVRSMHLGLALPDFPSSFFVQVYTAFHDFFSFHGHSLQVINYHWGRRFDRIAALKNVDALILISLCDEDSCSELMNYMNKARKPLVVIDRIPSRPEISAVATDNTGGGALAAEHLLALGHRQLAMLLAEPCNPNNLARLDGFRQEAERGGGTVEVIDCRTQPGDSPVNMAYRKMAEVMSSPCRFTGLFTDDHSGALGTLKVCRERGIAVPEQLSVVAFGNMSESDFIFPALTAVEQQFDRWAQEVMEIIMSLKDDPDSPARKTLVPPRLMVRESTVAPSFRQNS